MMIDEMNKIIVEATEKIDAFYFKTLQPFCEDVLEMKIKKDDLKDALLLWKKEKEKPKQEPKTVLYWGDGYADGEMVYDMAECPNCGYEYEDGDKDWGENFCPHCGQQLKWKSEG